MLVVVPASAKCKCLPRPTALHWGVRARDRVRAATGFSDFDRNDSSPRFCLSRPRAGRRAVRARRAPGRGRAAARPQPPRQRARTRDTAMRAAGRGARGGRRPPRGGARGRERRRGARGVKKANSYARPRQRHASESRRHHRALSAEAPLPAFKISVLSQVHGPSSLSRASATPMPRVRESENVRALAHDPPPLSLSPPPPSPAAPTPTCAALKTRSPCIT